MSKEKSEYSVALPQNYAVSIRVGNNPYEEECEVKSTLSWIEARIRTKFWDDVEVISIKLIREPKVEIVFPKD